MATTKKPSAAQIAARKKFAAMARSGAFKRKAAKRSTTKRATAKRKKNPDHGHHRTAADSRSASGALKLRGVRPAAKRAAPRKRNPDHVRIATPAAYAVHRATASGQPGALLAKFVGKSDAVQFARDWATSHKARAVVIGKAVA